MKITNVETISLSFSLEKPVYDANYEMATKPCLLVLISTDEGVSGLGESAHFGGPLVVLKTVIEEELKPHILGEDPLDTERIWEIMHKRSYKHGRGGILISAMSGIDVALGYQGKSGWVTPLQTFRRIYKPDHGLCHRWVLRRGQRA